MARQKQSENGQAPAGAGVAASATRAGLRPLPLAPPRREQTGSDRLITLQPSASAPERGASRPRWWRDQRRRRVLGLADGLTAGALGISCAVVAGQAALAGLIAMPVGLLVAKLLGLYDADHRAIRHLTVDEAPSLAAWVGIVETTTLALIPGPGFGWGHLLVAVGGIGLALVMRGAARWAWRGLTPPERTLVVGRGTPAEAIARKIELFDDMHLELVRSEGPELHLMARNGESDEALDRALQGIDRVVLAWSESDPESIERLFDECKRLEVKLSVVSPYRGRVRPTLELSQVAELPILEYNTWDVPRSTMMLKRACDVAVSSVALVALAPVALLIALAVKLGDGGPVLFRQRRAGRGGKPFTMLKFRSMTVDAERRLRELVDLDRLPEPSFKLRSDPRITPVGRFLRRFSLDEIPQLWNVLRGEMSLVGPRPEEMPMVERYAPDQAVRLQLKPGITGPMQVCGRGELTFEERLAVEVDYVENVSVMRDLKLVALTVPTVLRGTGAF